ncbi:hypothetical protein FGO68_gene4821 [Halteria grandinella]|uniref:Uncharacterized protein n=1 Tax=Halteria grandinella TaxID=5974 RepID=A0A8J8SYS3_HALGN|nr:hypothetical protein FGO68_gene4821 [Halteria grandinella]
MNNLKIPAGFWYAVLDSSLAYMRRWSVLQKAHSFFLKRLSVIKFLFPEALTQLPTLRTISIQTFPDTASTFYSFNLICSWRCLADEFSELFNCCCHAHFVLSVRQVFECLQLVSL